jgi:hypothetical protein
MIATLRHRLLRIPGRLIHHAGQLTLRLPPGHHLLPTVLSRLRTLPPPILTRPPSPDHSSEPATRSDNRALRMPTPRKTFQPKIHKTGEDQPNALLAESGLMADVRWLGGDKWKFQQCAGTYATI